MCTFIRLVPSIGLTFCLCLCLSVSLLALSLSLYISLSLSVCLPHTRLQDILLTTVHSTYSDMPGVQPAYYHQPAFHAQCAYTGRHHMFWTRPTGFLSATPHPTFSATQVTFFWPIWVHKWQVKVIPCRACFSGPSHGGTTA